MAKDRLYSIWSDMHKRCHNPNNYHYKDYGGRGITTCKAWIDFSAFEKWARANGYSESLRLGRKNINGNYSPSNCHWTTYEVLNNNKRSCIYVCCPDGQRRTLTQVARVAKLPPKTVSHRYHRSPNASYDWLTRPSESSRTKNPTVIVQSVNSNAILAKSLRQYAEIVAKTPASDQAMRDTLFNIASTISKALLTFCG